MLAYTKPKIVILDDDWSLLDVMEYYFTEHFQNTVFLKTFSKSQDFLTYIEDECYLSETPSAILNSFYASTRDNQCIAKTLTDLAELSAIIVLDQELRGEKIKGVDLSATLREYYPSSYISMLTSNISQNTAIELHNNHHIDLFVDKKNEDAIHNLYHYLSNHINTSKNEYLIDFIDVFGNSGDLDHTDYQLNKNILIEKNNPICYVTLNEQGNVAMMHENKRMSYWQYSPNTQQFIEYE